MPKFVPRERKHRKLAKTKSQTPLPPSNAETIVPETATEREERRRKLQEEIRAQQPEKINSKKRKRLDHYVDTKLKKEENAELIRKLAAQNVDLSLYQSSKKLGRVSESKREAIQRALREKQAGVDVHGDHDEILYQRRKSVDEARPAGQLPFADSAQQVGAEAVREVTQPAVKPQAAAGSGLKRPLEVGEDGKPMIKKRKRRKATRENSFQGRREEEGSDGADASDSAAEEASEGEYSDWGGFDSEAGSGSDADQDEDDSNTSIDGEEYGNEDSEGDENDEEEEEEDSEEAKAEKNARSSIFKLWATEQRNEALGFQPSTAPTNDTTARANFKPRQPSPDPVAQGLTKISKSTTARPKEAITIPRTEAIEKARLELPVVQEEQKIMEAIHNNPTVLVCGATGSGKTTQVPQMMYEAGYGSRIGNTSGPSATNKPSFGQGMIGVTQPRRVAATSVADRVAVELGPSYGKRVAHQVRYDTNVSKDTAIKFMTDGILLREISQDFVLSKYSAIVIDEAHERSVNTDILIGMLARIVPLRESLSKEQPQKYYPLKLVIMSATLRVSDFAQNTRLFRDLVPPIVEAEGRQFPVTTHFSRRTQRDFVAETVSKVSRGHKKLPPGGMLVFLTGQNEIQTVAKRLKDALGGNTAGYGRMLKAKENGGAMPMEADDFDDGPNSRRNQSLEGEESDDSDADVMGGDEDSPSDVEFEVEDDQKGPRGALKAHVLPLYASLPSHEQMRVFQPPPEGSRLIVLATNVAETSLTIPGVRYVFDCGRSKEKKYDTTSGVQTFEVDWVSKASASQRTGRAGRTGPGHCYRLYSSAVYEQYFAEHAVPEILRTPLESTVLQLKAMDIDNVVNFPFPTPPDRTQLAAAETLLKNLGALEARTGKITETGRELIRYPLSPRYGKMMMLAQRNNIMSLTIAAVAALAVGDLVIPEQQLTSSSQIPDGIDGIDSDTPFRAVRQAEAAALTAAQQRHQAYTRAQAKLAIWDDRSDALKLLTAIAAYSSSLAKRSNCSAFCADFFLREKGMQEAHQLRQQLHAIVRHNGTKLDFRIEVPLPTEKERKLLNQVLAAGFVDQVAIRADLHPSTAPSALRKPRRANEVPYLTLLSSTTEAIDHNASPADQEMARSVFVHAGSVLAKLSVKEMPEYIVYTHLSRAAPSTVPDGSESRQPRTRMHPLTTLGARQLAALAEGTPLLAMGKPIGKAEEIGGEMGKRRVCWVGLELRAPWQGGVGWPVGAWKVEQVRGGRGEWVVDRVLAR